MNTIVEIDTLVSKINNTVDMKLQAEGTIIGWILPLVVVCMSRFIVDIGIKEKYRIQC